MLIGIYLKSLLNFIYLNITSMALTTTHLPNLTLVTKGKVRDIYSLPSNPSALLFVATDRVFLPLSNEYVCIYAF